MTNDRERSLRGVLHPPVIPADPTVHHDDEGYPRPRIPLAANWVQPRRRFDFDKDYMRLPRHRVDYGRIRRRG